MNRFWLFLAVVLGLYLPWVEAASIPHTALSERVAASDVIFRGTVLSATGFRGAHDGFIYTRAVVRVDKVFKGKLPPAVALVNRGGTVDGITDMSCLTPDYRAGQERIFLLNLSTNGDLAATLGTRSTILPVSEPDLLPALESMTANGPVSGADATGSGVAVPMALGNPGNGGPNPVLLSSSSSATNLFTNSFNIPARWLPQDRGEAIPYVIDADYLPAGITLAQATNAVKNALAQWTAVTSLKYRFAGLQSFGMASPDVTNMDEVLRIQLHDHYNFIGGGNGSGDVLGQGGYESIFSDSPSGWTLGGNVKGNDFNKVVQGYVVLSHTNQYMQNLSTFSEVLTHEIGHTIGMAHSSQNPNETNQYLMQAVMYFEAHADGRGAYVTNYDSNVVQQVHPPNGTPPYCYSRVMDVVTWPVGAPTNQAINVVQVKGYSLRNTTLTFAMADGTTNAGSFTTSNNYVRFTPKSNITGPGVDPSGSSYYDLVYTRYSDGVNSSPYATVRTISLLIDHNYQGIPDSWRTTYFGTTTIGPKENATDDYDGDGYSNLQEFILGSNPTSKTSNLRFTFINPTNIQWQAKPYEL